jgi:hypothetical protein
MKLHGRRTGMRYALMAGVFMLFAASAACAGGTPDTDAESLQMVFEFNGLSQFELDTYAGGLGMRYFLDDEGLATRISFNAGYSTDEKDGDKNTVSLVGGSMLLEKFLNPHASVAPFVGIGFAYFYTSDKRPTDEGELKVTSNIIEVPLVAGFQWWFTDALALGGEYRWGIIRYTSDKYELGGYGIGDGESFSTGIYAASVFLSVVLR